MATRGVICIFAVCAVVTVAAAADVRPSDNTDTWDHFPTVDELLGDDKRAPPSPPPPEAKTPPAQPLESVPRPVPRKREPVYMVYEFPFIQKRLDEFFKTLQINLNHPSVAQIHLMVTPGGGRLPALFVAPTCRPWRRVNKHALMQACPVTAARAYLEKTRPPKDPKKKLVLVNIQKQPLYRTYFEVPPPLLAALLCAECSLATLSMPTSTSRARSASC
jgi:hypothetical protein